LILIDTNVISQLTREQPEAFVFDWIVENEADILVSTVVLGEMAFGISRLSDGRRKAGLRYALDRVIDRFSSKIVPYGVYEAEAYGDIMANAERFGRPMSIPDGMIAASAHVLRVPLATRNVKDFETTSLTLFNPWDLGVT
jgi:predicted nucleic acid-binding protein